MVKRVTTETNLKSNIAEPPHLIGRADEISKVSKYLLETSTRLLTLTGPGGIGKTSLAQQVAANLRNAFSDGVHFVPLDSISNPELLIPTIAQTLGIKDIGGAGGLSIPEMLILFLQGKQLLLLLDNFEQIVSAASGLAKLLSLCHTIKVLVTSRAALHIEKEQEFRVPPLAAPDPEHLPTLEEFTQYAAIEFFLQRAQSRQSGFTLTSANARSIAEICAYVDGNPLAIKFATTYVNVLSPQGLFQQLKKDPLEILTGDSRDVPVRQQNISNVLMWSYRLLDSHERQLFRRLSVFVDGCTLEALERIGTILGDEAGHILTGVASLIDKSFLERDEREEEPRFTMLPILRGYGQDRLEEEQEEDETRWAHARYYLELVETAALKLRSSEQESWVQRLEQEYENLRAAFDWLFARGRIELALRLAESLGWYWVARGRISEGLHWFERVLSLCSEEMVVTHSGILNNIGMLELMRGNIPQAEHMFMKGLAFSKKRNNREAIAFALQGGGTIAWVKNDLAEAEAFIAQALELWKQLGEREGIAWSLCILAMVLAKQQKYTKAFDYAEESLRLFRASGDAFGLAYGLLRMAQVLYLQDDAIELQGASGSPSRRRAESLKKGRLSANTYLEESLAIFKRLGNRWGIIQAFSLSGRMVAIQGDQSEAYSFYKKALEITLEGQNRNSVGSFLDIAACLEGLAFVEGSRGYLKLATQFLGQADNLRKTIGAPLPMESQILYDETIAAARRHLGNDAFTDAWDQGSTMQPEQTFDLLVRHDAQLMLEAQPKRTANPDGLTSREVEVLCLLANGLSDAQVAERLFISRRTVNTHVTRIYRKLEIDSRSAATRYVVENHLDSPNVVPASDSREGVRGFAQK